MAVAKKGTYHRFGHLLFIILAILLIVMTMAVTWLFVNYRDAMNQIAENEIAASTGELTEGQVREIINSVGSHIILPADEMPVVARLEDAENLKAEQAFFKYASNGDFLLIYSDRGIIYSPAKDVLINVGPTQSPQIQGSSVEVRNGSLTSGAAQSLGEQINAQPEYTVVGVGNASNFNYEKTVIVNLGEGDVSDLEEAFGVTAIKEMPEGEAQAQAEIVVIIGNGQ
ncbi:LytR C-terminal domain-containing protein [Patescibacteria group bacterium]|nr:LytR C-terminal domain-containing protein [Patescibacteria group bacterium]